MLSVLCGLAFAEDATAVVDGETVRGIAHLAVSPERVLAELRDPSWEVTVGGQGVRATLKGRDGPCQDVGYVAPNRILEAVYEVRRCPTADGWQSTLLASNMLDTFRNSWKVLPEGDGCRVTYETELTTSLWIPDALIRAETRRGVLGMMVAMEAWGRTAAGR